MKNERETRQPLPATDSYIAMIKPTTTFVNQQYARTNHSLFNYIQPYRMDCNAQCQLAILTYQTTRLYKLKYRYKPNKITNEAPNLKQLQIKGQSHITPCSPAHTAESVFVRKWSAATGTKTSVAVCVSVQQLVMHL